MSINVCVLSGRLVRDPELKYIPSTGKPVSTFTIAVDSGYGTSKKTIFVNVQAWGKTAENVANYLRKGSMAGVHGSLNIRQYDRQDGTKGYATEIVANSVEFMGPAPGNAASDYHEVPSAGFTAADFPYTQQNDTDRII